MGCGSKTRYSVASSTSPVFDMDNRINQFEAAMLDYTANSVIEYSEYMKSYYNTSRLRGYKQFINWWRKQGNEEVFGKVTATFFGNADIDNTAVAEAIKPMIDLEPTDIFRVFNTDLNFFSEDFFVRHLATEQDKTDWFTSNTDSDYTIDYPNDNNYLVATFTDGRTITGTIPDFSAKTRFLEISYSILSSTTETTDPVYDEEGNLVTDGTTTTVYTYKYGYYQYAEGSGNEALDTIIQNNGIEEDYTFFPVIPMRTNTAWFTGDKADRIEAALDFLEFNSAETKGSAYETIQNGVEEGLTEGNIGDIDYITMWLGVSLNSNHPADCRYMYEFFFNLYANQALKDGVDTSEIYTPKNVSNGTGVLNQFYSNFLGKDWTSYNNYNTIHINCSASNLNIYIKWLGSNYFEANGQFKPDAKRGDYGVLCNQFTYTYSYQQPKRDSEGNVIVRHTEDGTYVVYETVTKSTTFDMVFFCHQYSNTRWRFVLFIDPYLSNLVYHGKTVDTGAWTAFSECTTLGTVTHDFTSDWPSAPTNFHKLTFRYVEVRGEPTSAFLIPLEWNTFMECGIVVQTELTYGCAYLIFNSWVKYKTGGFFSGFFGALLGIVTVVIGAVVSVFCAPLGSAIMGLGVGMLIVSAIQILTPMITKILSTFFGEAFGNFMYSLINTLLKIVITVIAIVYSPFTGGTSLAYATYFWAAVGASTAMSFDSAMQNGASLGSALFQGALAGASTFVAGWAAPTLGTDLATGIGTGLDTFGSSLAEGDSFGDALLASIGAGLLSWGTSKITQVFNNQFNILDTSNLTPGRNPQLIEALSQALSSAGNKVLKNPATYVELMKVTQQEVYIHKLNNLENDFQEFNNALKTAYDALYNLQNSITSTITAEFVCKLQTCVGRLTTQFPDVMAALGSENFISFSTSTGMDFTFAVLSGPSSFVDNKLSMQGYSPEPLYYLQEEVAWIS